MDEANVTIGGKPVHLLPPDSERRAEDAPAAGGLSTGYRAPELELELERAATPTLWEEGWERETYRVSAPIALGAVLAVIALVIWRLTRRR